MPSSNPETLPVAINLLWKLMPKRVLDIGAGYGKYGVLFREYLEERHAGIADPNSLNTPQGRRKRMVRIDAVEGFAAYIGDLHKVVYDNVYIENILEFVKKNWKYDVICMFDVLEHLDKAVATNLLQELVARATMGVLISVPAHVIIKHAVFDNPLETHRSTWNSCDFRRIAPFVRVGRKGSHLIVFLTKNKENFRVVRGNRFGRRLRIIRRALRDSW